MLFSSIPQSFLLHVMQIFLRTIIILLRLQVFKLLSSKVIMSQCFLLLICWQGVLSLHMWRRSCLCHIWWCLYIVQFVSYFNTIIIIIIIIIIMIIVSSTVLLLVQHSWKTKCVLKKWTFLEFKGRALLTGFQWFKTQCPIFVSSKNKHFHKNILWFCVSLYCLTPHLKRPFPKHH